MCQASGGPSTSRRCSTARGVLLLVPLLCSWAIATCEQPSAYFDIPAAASAAQEPGAATRNPVAAAGAAAAAALPGPLAGRSLLQNPDRPALTRYGGVNMTMGVAAGYPLETYKVPTSDGWVLTMYRIPHGAKRRRQPGRRRPVVFLQHGFSLSSACFTVLNQDESLAYILADAGFDVWLPNTRGNTFSRGNTRYSHRDFEYWYHTFDDYARVDVPAMISKALEVSGTSKLAYVGHSQGCTIGYAMLAALPHMNDKISVMIQMAPGVFRTRSNRLQAPFLKAMASVRTEQILTLAGSGEFLWYRFFAPFIPQCRQDFWAEGCVMTVFLMFYGPSKFISVDDLSLILQTWPATVSTRNAAHFGQLYSAPSPRFQMFDHGTNCSVGAPFHETCNQMQYGSSTPPEYDLSRVTTNVAIFMGDYDILSTDDDAAEQRRRLVNANVFEVVYEKYSHMDFVWDRSARHALDVVDIAYRFSPGSI